MTSETVRKYAKALVAVAGAVVVIGQAIIAPHADVASIIAAVLTAFGVYRVPNK